MKKSSDENIAFPRVRNFLRLWSEVAQSTFPFMREEFGELDEMDRMFVTVCESVVKPEAFEYAKWKGIGRPTTNRTSVFKAFLFKALYDIPTTRELARRLRRDVRACSSLRWSRRCVCSADPFRPEMGARPEAIGSAAGFVTP